jgi:membrane associated rhomboid family serine protease
MFLPIGDEPNPRGVAWVNWLFILSNVAVYVLVTLPLGFTPADTHSPVYAEYVRVITSLLGPGAALHDVTAHLTAYDLFVFEHGFRPSNPTLQSAFAAMFLHGGLMHLVGNLLFLWIYGDNVEARLGRFPYFLAYLLTGMCGNAMHMVISGHSPMPLVGASGAISGVLGFYFVFFPENRIRVLITLFPIYFDVVRIRSRWVLGAYFVLDNLLPILLGSQSSVAYGAHLGGFLSGFVVARLLRNRDTAVPVRSLPPPSASVDTSPAADVTRRLEAHDLPGAAAAYLSGWGRPWLREVPATQALIIADWLSVQGQARQALAVYQRALMFEVNDDEAARAHLGAGLALLNGLGRPTDAYQHLVRAQQSREPDVARAAQAAIVRIQQMQKLKFRGR